jgi:hypothetical protein
MKNRLRKIGKTGQAIVEYILLLVIAVSIAAFLVRSLVSRNEDQPGIIINVWQSVLTTIGVDPADDISREED